MKTMISIIICFQHINQHKLKTYGLGCTKISKIRQISVLTVFMVHVPLQVCTFDFQHHQFTNASSKKLEIFIISFFFFQVIAP